MAKDKLRRDHQRFIKMEHTMTENGLLDKTYGKEKVGQFSQMAISMMGGGLMIDLMEEEDT